MGVCRSTLLPTAATVIAQRTGGPPIQDGQTRGHLDAPQRGGDEHCGSMLIAVEGL